MKRLMKENVDNNTTKQRKKKLKRVVLKETAERDLLQMDPFKLRQLLSEYGDVERLYLAPKNPSACVVAVVVVKE